ncbi:NADH-quinone oxidoreductase subunit F [Dethiosulfatibacter aminovorans DSM 17477]|uniref:NADH-quinone oxidoreductase subunit F n=1 Tax=Dethiosulfatibacter aminovorans DSM 17477 TaxID=1121476 RepID=A0A1M6JWT4_9FIRM|nr:NADH-ubiquinone oxidoreductase-F iron-sulfur binding region domain-containing protein [Dethiosulfatibacter aminovorans]SHJ51136.1 NADH-quinone oxidoreductase subunit F [Dethiosulfatibacter aminovorans DSM 17477]
MSKTIRSSEELKKISNAFKDKMKKYTHTVNLCYGAGCLSSDSKSICEALERELEKQGLSESVKVNNTGCMGMCAEGPMMVVNPGMILYCRLTEDKIREIVDSHIINGKLLEKYCYFDKKTKEYITAMNDIEFYKKQYKIVLKNCGRIDFNSLKEYIANDGYSAIEKVLSSMSREEAVDIISKSGLRGRGGGGFPTGLKWKLAMKSDEKEKYVICNADEGDPGAFMDRSLVEGDPHSVIEGMMIAGYCIGAEKGVVYVRAEYPLAIDRLGRAIQKARQKGLLGMDIFNSGFNFDIEVRIGAGAFVCGEETALMNSVEGRRGEPRQKPPYPSDEGLFKKPTIINNVETFGNIASIILKGADWFSSIGTENSKGTKIFALAGDINNTGIIEVPMGISLGEIVYDIGGGIPSDKKFKVAQTGGPSGGCLTQEHLNTPIDYDSLTELGAIMGSGGLVCMDEDTCMVDVARYFMEFVQDESCGKCVACRIGTKRMLEILERITQGQGTDSDIEDLKDLGRVIKDTALCGLGQTAPNPVLSTLKYFMDEYLQHIEEGYCTAGVCGELFLSPCENACPANINVPGYLALVARGRIEDAYNLIRQENPFPAVCGDICTHPCEYKCRRAQIDEAIAISDIKKYIAEQVLNSDKPIKTTTHPKNGKKVAIIGAGPSGLTCGYYLARLGYDIDVYEEQNVAGGVLAFGIPQYRLPKEILKKEIDSIRQAGVNIILNHKVGKDIEFEQLKKDYDALYIATGTQFSRKVGIEGENLKGVYHGLDFLKDVNLNKEVPIGRKVAVIGGGNTAIDAARVALRMGAEEVHILYRRRIEDMPADKREIRDAMEEGIQIHELVMPLEIAGSSENGVEKIICSRINLEGFDSKGRRKPVKRENSEFDFEVDMVIPAVSQYSDLPFISKDEVELTGYGSFVIDSKNNMTSMEGVFAGGDVVRGSDVVITAIADGKKSAVEIDKYLGGTGELNKGEEIEIPDDFEEHEIFEHERFPMKILSSDKRKNNFDEVNKGYHRLNAMAEAMRCLRCDRRI